MWATTLLVSNTPSDLSDVIIRKASNEKYDTQDTSLKPGTEYHTRMYIGVTFYIYPRTTLGTRHIRGNIYAEAYSFYFELILMSICLLYIIFISIRFIWLDILEIRSVHLCIILLNFSRLTEIGFSLGAVELERRRVVRARRQLLRAVTETREHLAWFRERWAWFREQSAWSRCW